jgi:hypothetical protein
LNIIFQSEVVKVKVMDRAIVDIMVQAVSVKGLLAITEEEVELMFSHLTDTHMIGTHIPNPEISL